MPDFDKIEFLKNCTTDDWFAKMLTIIPSDLDMSEGNHSWNLTRPTALVAAYLTQYMAPEVLKLILPEYSYGEFVDAHAKSRTMTRRRATAANGEITITGAAGSTIPVGSLFATAAINDEPSVDYETLEAAEIPESGTVTIPIQCTKTGTIGNTAAETIVLVGSRLTGITAVVNEKAVTGGVEQESDESLIERILEYDRSIGISFTGCPADYKRWATSVPGVGEAVVIPARDDSGLVTIILTDGNGEPATEQLCTEVYNYIMRPDEPGQRLTNPNALLLVIPPATIQICVSVTVELKTGYSLEAVRKSFMEQLALYMPVAADEGEVKYTRVAAVLTAVEGANDFIDLKIGTKDGELGVANIPIDQSQLPIVEEADLTLTTGTVWG